MSSRYKQQSADGIVLYAAGYGIMEQVFAGPPTASSVGFAKGCIWRDLTNAVLYYNSGTNLSATWVAFSSGVDLNGLTATAAEINSVAKLSTREVLAGATLAATAALHSGRTVRMPAVCAVTLPASTGSGAVYRFVQQVAATTVTITATAADMYGQAWLMSDNSAAVLGYTAAGSTIITFDGSTRGGIKGAIVEIEDAATNFLVVRVMSGASGTEATPFS